MYSWTVLWYILVWNLKQPKKKVTTSLPCKTEYTCFCCEHVSFVYHFLWVVFCFKFCLRELWWLWSHFSLSVVYYLLRGKSSYAHACVICNFIWQVQWHISSAILPFLLSTNNNKSVRYKFFLDNKLLKDFVWSQDASLMT